MNSKNEFLSWEEMIGKEREKLYSELEDKLNSKYVAIEK
jgi:hypothetical protein